MLLCIDVGNTNIKLALYDKGLIKTKIRISTDPKRTPDELAAQLCTLFGIHNVDAGKIRGAIISSVVPTITGALREAVKIAANTDSLVIGPGIKTGLDIRIDNPAKVGSDIVCACVAVKNMYSCPAIIVGLGTATTVLYMNENRAYCGGSILPGVQISLEALTQKCALLPSVDVANTKKLIGTNTSDSIKSGIIYGAAAAVSSMIDFYEKEIGQRCTVVATGGFASSIVSRCPKDIIVNDDLILEGLRIIYEKNAPD